MWKVVFAKQAQKDAKKVAQAGLKARTKTLLGVIADDPFAYQPAYEPLVGNLKGYYSRRINITHRLVYLVIEGETEDGFEGVVKVVSMWSRYEGVR